MKVTVRKGDTLWYYSQLFNVPLRLLIDANGHLTPQYLHIGQEVLIPGYTEARHVIQKGDSIWELATEKHLAVESLLIANPNTDRYNLQAGQDLRIPVRVTEPIVHWRTQYDYGTMWKDLRQLHELYPFITMSEIGNSVMGKPLPELRVGTGRKKIHWNGSFHANEWATTSMIMKFLNDYLLALTNRGTIRGLYMAPFYEEAALSIVPMVDPDGVDLVINGPPEEQPYHDEVLKINGESDDFSGWKANIRGVDLNDQFPARWYIEARRREQQPAPANYPGPKPLSEPEAAAVANLTKRLDYSRVVAFHAQGEVIYWGFLGYEPPASHQMIEEFSRVSGYEPIKYIDSYAGYKDWFIQDWRKPGFTVEIGKGAKPLPLSQFGEIYQKCLGIFLASLYM